MSRTSRKCSISECCNMVWAREMCKKHYARWRTHGDPLITKTTPAKAGEPMQFANSISEIGEGCIIWPYAKNNMGYGQINTSGGRKILAHRLVCTRFNGAPPSPFHVAAHSCGNGHLGCVSPWHLSWKTQRENVHDSISHGTLSCGERHATKLTAPQVFAIKTMLTSEPQSSIARRFGISQSMVSRIHLGKAWRSV